ncbi:MAG: hypothetical protein J5803_03490, partial [Desulfovibrio sp.]|nr:hypothetical protein [Desulfovibrio sp.]
GREYLADLSEAQEKYSFALLLRSEIASCRKGDHDYGKLLALREKESVNTPENAPLFEEAEKKLRSIETLRQNTQLLRRYYRDASQWHDPFLSKLYEEKLHTITA